MLRSNFSSSVALQVLTANFASTPPLPFGSSMTPFHVALPPATFFIGTSTSTFASPRSSFAVWFNMSASFDATSAASATLVCFAFAMVYCSSALVYRESAQNVQFYLAYNQQLTAKKKAGKRGQS